MFVSASKCVVSWVKKRTRWTLWLDDLVSLGLGRDCTTFYSSRATLDFIFDSLSQWDSGSIFCLSTLFFLRCGHVGVSSLLGVWATLGRCVQSTPYSTEYRLSASISPALPTLRQHVCETQTLTPEITDSRPMFFYLLVCTSSTTTSSSSVAITPSGSQTT